MKRVMLTLAASSLILVIVAVGYITTQCPCEQMPGVAL